MRLDEIRISTAGGILQSKTVKDEHGSMNYRFQRGITSGYGFVVINKVKGIEGQQEQKCFFGDDYQFDKSVIPKIMTMVMQHMEKVTSSFTSKEYLGKLSEVVKNVLDAHAIYCKHIDDGNAGKIKALDELQDQDLEDYIDL